MIGETLQALACARLPGRPLPRPRRRRPLHGRTVEIALAAGVEVHEHDGAVRGKGPALAVDDRTPARPSERPRRRRRRHRRRRHDRRPGFLERHRPRVRRRAPPPCRASTGSATPARRRAPACAPRRSPCATTSGRSAARRSAASSGPLRQRHGLHRRTSCTTGPGPTTSPRTSSCRWSCCSTASLVAYAPDAVVEAEMPATLEGARDAERALGARSARPRPSLRPARCSARRSTGRDAPRVAAVDAVLDHLVPPLSVLVGGRRRAWPSPRSSRRRSLRGRWRRLGAWCSPPRSSSTSCPASCSAACPASVYRSLLHAPAMVLLEGAPVAADARAAETRGRVGARPARPRRPS